MHEMSAPKNPLPKKRMLNTEELACYIGLSPQTIRNKFHAGDFPIPAKRIFRRVLWDIKDVDQYLDRLPKIGIDPID
jgi:predicted DNA-binding transcriptional regulator AlpA